MGKKGKKEKLKLDLKRSFKAMILKHVNDSVRSSEVPVGGAACRSVALQYYKILLLLLLYIVIYYNISNCSRPQSTLNFDIRENLLCETRDSILC